MEDVKSLSDQELYSSRHLRSYFEASHSLASRTLPSLPLDSSLGNMGNTSPESPERKNKEGRDYSIYLSIFFNHPALPPHHQYLNS